ncbi:arginase family protein [Actinacidiphila glaucinigra]|uniref:arginase family protein n=1 Tax=Actinacidiphila glaucinigra TaxID=235986 RepID=UPI0037B809FA
MADRPTADTRMLVLNRDLVRTGAGTFWLTAEGREISLGPSMATLGYQFAIPTTVAAVVDGTGMDSSVLTEAVTRLEDLGVLVTHNPAGRAVTGTGGLFQSPLLSVAEALAGGTSDVVVFGVPYDVGASHRPGSRFGPDYLRRVSGSLFQYRPEAGSPTGMWDPVRGRQVLSGVRLADLGDIDVGSVLTRNAEAFDVTEQLTSRITGAGRFPVMLGGDHSVALAAIRGVLRTYPRLGVIHIDAHADYAGPRRDDWRQDCHHGNFMGWVVGDARVERVVQFGIRQLTATDTEPSPKVTRWSGRSAARVPIDEVLADLPEDLPYYVTVDVDGLDPAFIPATGTPLPGGFTHTEAVALLEGLCAARRVVGMDLVELIADSSDQSGLVAADIVLRTIDAATAGCG